jgi:hypothetical protein
MRPMAGRQSGIVRAVWVVAGFACIALVAGCNLRPSAPESRAEYFIKKSILEPQAVDDLRAVAQLNEGESPETLLGDLPTRTAVAYLRARARLGTKIGAHVSGVTETTAGRKLVNVVVTEGVAIGGAEPVRFQVEMQRFDADWRVVSVHAG